MKHMKKKQKKYSALIRRLLLAVLGIMVGLNVYLANAQGLVGNQLPMPFGFGAAVVVSGSMEPTLEVNDLIFVRERADYEIGDIVVYQSGQNLIVHRIIAREGERITTQGDANNVADAPIQINAVKGKVISRIPFFGSIVNVLKTPLVGILILIGAVLLMECSFRTEKRKKEKSLDEIKEEIRLLKDDLYKDNSDE